MLNDFGICLYHKKSIKTVALDFSEKRFPCLRWSQENRGGCNRCGGRFSGNKKTFLSLLLWQYGDDIKDTLDIVLWEKRNQVKYLVFQVKGKQSRCWLFSQKIYKKYYKNIFVVETRSSCWVSKWGHLSSHLGFPETFLKMVEDQERNEWVITKNAKCHEC